MSGRNISYIKPSEPKFLTEFKKKAGYKAGPDVNTKKEMPQFEDEGDEDRPVNEDEKPVVVILGDGDLTHEEAEECSKEIEKKQDKELIEGGKIVFKRPSKKLSDADSTFSDLNASTSKKKKLEQPDKKKESRVKKVKNANLLSFADEDPESD